MVVSGVVCEYNPFHNGHKYMLDGMRKGGATHIIGIMSGNFVQRGEAAVCDKYLRAEMAVRNGADLIIELPLPYAVGTAETFARGSVGILDKLNCVDSLYFGSESSIDELKNCLDVSETEGFGNKIKSLLDEGLSYPTAFSKAMNNPVADTPNNILALEYMKQLRTLESKITPHAILRMGAQHDSNEAVGGFLSASAIRAKIRLSEDVNGFAPENVIESLKEAMKNGEIPSDMSRIEIAILSKLRSMTTEELAGIADVNEGLEYRLEKAISHATSITELYELTKTRRYTNAKIRRIILCAFLGVTKEMQSRTPEYINVLACNEKGIEIIRRIKESSDITVITKHSESENLSQADKAFYGFTDKCDDQFALTIPIIRKCGYNRGRKFGVMYDTSVK